MADNQKITYKKHTFLSSLAMGISALLIVVVISCTTLIIYGMHFIGDRSEQIVQTVGAAIGGLDEFQKALPPIIADILNDQRRPDYRDQIELSARISPTSAHNNHYRIAVEAKNKGEEVVSMLTIRVILLDENDEVISETNEWIATPITTNGGLPGPIMPGSNRRYTAHTYCNHRDISLDSLKTEIEITDIRVWNAPEQKQPQTALLEAPPQQVTP